MAIAENNIGFALVPGISAPCALGGIIPRETFCRNHAVARPCKHQAVFDDVRAAKKFISYRKHLTRIGNCRLVHARTRFRSCVWQIKPMLGESHRVGQKSGTQTKNIVTVIIVTPIFVQSPKRIQRPMGCGTLPYTLGIIFNIMVNAHFISQSIPPISLFVPADGINFGRIKTVVCLEFLLRQPDLIQIVRALNPLRPRFDLRISR